MASIFSRPQPITGTIKVADGKIDDKLGGAAGWQASAYVLWRALGELHYPTSHMSRLISKLDWRVSVSGVELDPEGDATRIADILDRITNGYGVSEASRLLALNYLIGAEMWYVGTKQGDSEERKWRVYSVISKGLREAVKNTESTRVHVINSDPVEPDMADGPFMTLIGPAKELMVLESLSRSQTRSRISQSGIFLYPEEIDFEGEEAVADELEEAMLAPIADENSASAMVPLSLAVPSSLIEHFRHLTFDRQYDDDIHTRIEKVTKRIALGLDIPAELLLGLGDLNHWSAWLVKEDTWSSHGDPLAATVGEVLSAAANETLTESGEIVITPDPSELLAKRSTVKDALEAARYGAVGPRFIREAIGASETDAPTDEELADMAEMARAIRGGAASEPAAEGPPAEDGSPVTAASPPPNASEEVLDRFGEELAAFDDRLRDRLEGAMTMAIQATRSRIGAKLRTATRNDADKRERIDGVDNADVAAALGRDTFDIIDLPAAIGDALRPLEEWWSATLDHERERLGKLASIDTNQPEWLAAQVRSIEVLHEGLGLWMEETVTRRSSNLPLTPRNLVRQVVAVAGGSH